MSAISTELLVRVPVLSKQIVLMCALSYTLLGSFPYIAERSRRIKDIPGKKFSTPMYPTGTARLTISKNKNTIVSSLIARVVSLAR